MENEKYLYPHRRRIEAMRHILRVFIVISIALPLSTLSSSRATESLKRFFAQVETFRANFDQVVLDEGLNPIEESRGRMEIKRPGRFRWDYEPPLQQLIVSDGDRVWIHDVDLEQITVRRLIDTVGETPATILAGKGNISQNYTVRELGHYGKLAWVQMKPKPGSDGFYDMRIGFEDGRLRIMELVDGLGQTTRITLSNSVENLDIADDNFRFIPPSGVDVIDQTKK